MITPLHFETYVGGLLRARHIDRLLALAERYEDEAYEVGSHGNPKREKYLRYWIDRTQRTAVMVGSEPLLHAMRLA